MKDYKKIIKYNRPSKKIVPNWDVLNMHLVLLNISPQEAFDTIHNSKRKYNARFYWAMTRIAFYVNERFSEYKKELEKQFNEVTIKARKLKNKPHIPLYKDLSFSKKRYFMGAVFGSISRTPKEYREERGKKIFNIKLSKKINTCKKVVYSNEFEKEFKNFYPLEKFDARKEVENLNKLITEKRHQDKLTSGKSDIAVNKTMKKHAVFCEQFTDKKYYSYPAKYLRDGIFKSIGIYFKEIDIVIKYRYRKKSEQ